MIHNQQTNDCFTVSHDLSRLTTADTGVQSSPMDGLCYSNLILMEKKTALVAEHNTSLLVTRFYLPFGVAGSRVFSSDCKD